MTTENKTLEKENDILLELVNINKDASEFYIKAQKQVKATDLKDKFKELESLHNSAISSFQKELARNGADQSDRAASETMVGKARQLFSDVASKFSGNPDETVISQLEEAEDRCLNSLQDAMTNENVSSNTKETLKSELEQMRKSHDHMKAIKDTMKAA